MQRKVLLPFLLGLVGLSTLQYIATFSGMQVPVKSKKMHSRGHSNIGRGAEGDAPQLPIVDESAENSEYGAALIGAVIGTLLFPVLKGIPLGVALAGAFWFSSKADSPNLLGTVELDTPMGEFQGKDFVPAAQSASEALQSGGEMTVKGYNYLAQQANEFIKNQ